MALELLNYDEAFDVAETALENVTKPDPEVVYQVRPVPPELVRQTQRKHTKVTRPNGIREEAFDRDGFLDDLLDYALVGWRGITAKGEPAPCTRENKVRGLDVPRKMALLAAAGANQSTTDVREARDHSFRSPASVL